VPVRQVMRRQRCVSSISERVEQIRWTGRR
jgi:hypothetical protein